MHKFAIKFWSQTRVFQKTWPKIFLDLHSIDSYKKVTTCTSILFMNYTCSTKKFNSCNWFAGITPKKDKGKRNKIYYKTCWNSNDLADFLLCCSRQNKMWLNALRKAKTRLQHKYVAALKSLSLDNFWFPADRMSFFSLKGKKKNLIRIIFNFKFTCN